jgi:apyrase
MSAIAGREKGIYAWVSANYALGTLHSDPLQTTGIIELGRASIQVTFVPEVPPPPSFKHTLELGGKTFVLYSYSFLNYGQEAAWDSLLESVLTGSATASKALHTSQFFFHLYFLGLTLNWFEGWDDSKLLHVLV